MNGEKSEYLVDITAFDIHESFLNAAGIFLLCDDHDAWIVLPGSEMENSKKTYHPKAGDRFRY